MKNQAFWYRTSYYRSRLGRRPKFPAGSAATAAYLYLNGQERPDPAYITEDSAFFLCNGTASQGGVRTPAGMFLRVSRQGAGTLTFTGPFHGEKVLFQASGGKTVFTGGKSNIGILLVDRGAGTTPVVEISGVELETIGARVGDLSGELHITGGAVVTAAAGLILGNGTFLVSGAGSHFIAAYSLADIGAAGTGSVILREGGRLSATFAPRELLLGESRKGHGILNIGAPFAEVAAAPGVLDMTNIDSGEGKGTIVFNHTAKNYAFTATGTREGEPIEIDGAVDLIFGSGTTTLCGANRSNGTTTITGGTLVLAPPAKPWAASDVGAGRLTVGAHGRLAGVGTVPAEAVVWGILTPGDATCGRLDFADGLSLLESATVGIRLTGPDSAHDVIRVEGSLNFGGELHLTFTGGYRPAAGTTFQIFTGNYAADSSFSSITFTQPGYEGTFNNVTGLLTLTKAPEL
jgi:hypothetical protein